MKFLLRVIFGIEKKLLRQILIKGITTRQILIQGKTMRQSLKKSFTTCQVLYQLLKHASSFELKISQRVRF